MKRKIIQVLLAVLNSRWLNSDSAHLERPWPSLHPRHESLAPPDYADHWHVEETDAEGRVYVAVFSGPDAHRRAVAYTRWRNEDPLPGTILRYLKRLSSKP